MARRIKKRILPKPKLRTVHRAQPLKDYTPKAIKRVKTQLRKVAPIGTLAKREPTKRVILNEVKAIRKKRVLPVLSKISPYSCRRKRAKARHDYFSMRAAGAGGSRKKGPHKNRFTVRCT